MRNGSIARWPQRHTKSRTGKGCCTNRRRSSPIATPAIPSATISRNEPGSKRLCARARSGSTAARRKLEAGAGLAGNADAVRLYHQLLGVRDQIAECVRRMPLEAGELYKEDKERFEHATAALERVWQRWEMKVS